MKTIFKPGRLKSLAEFNTAAMTTIKQEVRGMASEKELQDMMKEFERDIERAEASSAPAIQYVPKKNVTMDTALRARDIDNRVISDELAAQVAADDLQSLTVHRNTHSIKRIADASPTHGTGSTGGHNSIQKKKRLKMKAAGKVWEDPTLESWPEKDFRLFCGDLGNDVNEDTLRGVFGQYSSFAMCKVVRDGKSGNSRGYGFVSFLDPDDYAKAFRDWNGKYVGTRPIKLRKGKWMERVHHK